LPDGKIKSNHEKIIIETECLSTKKIEKTSLLNIWKLEHVEWEKSLSNDPNEIAKILGIEAAIHILYQEIKQVLSFDGNYINHRHIMILVDAMTFVGKIVATNRHGMKEVPIGIIQKASYEEVTTVLSEAGIYSKFDNMKGVSSNIMFGQVGEYGTGLPKLVVDHECYDKCQSKKNNMLMVPKNINIVTTSQDIFGCVSNKCMMFKNQELVMCTTRSAKINPTNDNLMEYRPYYNNNNKLNHYTDSNYEHKFHEIPTNELYFDKQNNNDQNDNNWRPSSPKQFLKNVQYKDKITDIHDIDDILNSQTTHNLADKFNEYITKRK
jgi:hypothetical protein